MGLPINCDPLDPYLVRLRAIALALPGAAEKLVVGHPAFYTTKVFGYFGMSYKVDGQWVHSPRSACFLLPEDERLALLEDARCYVPGYIGPYGWLGMLLSDDTDWDEVTELVELSYRETAGKRRVAELDARS